MVGMAEPGDTSNWHSSTRGEQAWKETRERIAARNAEARKAGKQRREAYERERDSLRRAALARGDATLIKPRRP
jgi:hypothetical protein